jgi:TonB family protein
MAASAVGVSNYSGGGERQLGRRSVMDCGLVTVEMSPAGFGLMVNACEKGIGIYTLTSLERGQQVQVLFHVPGSSNRVEGLGEVTWSGNSHAGLRLKQFKPSSEAPFKRWVASLPEMPKVENPLAQRKKTFSEAVDRLREEIVGANLSEDGALALTVERLLELTGVNGAAIALGNSTEMVCRASTGLAPEIGVRISSTNGLTGECIRSAKLIYCEDTELDTRVDREICRQLNMRSSLMVPIMHARKMVGVLEAFSPAANSFTADHIRLMQELAELTALIVYDAKDVQAVIPSMEALPVSGLERDIEPFEPAIDDPVQVRRTEAKPPQSVRTVVAAVKTRGKAFLTRKFLLTVGLVMVLALAGSEWYQRTNASVKQSNSEAPSTASPKLASTTLPAITTEAAKQEAVPPAAQAAKLVDAPARPSRGVVNVVSSRPVPVETGNETAATEAALTGGAPYYPQAEPEYPETARKQRLQGDVVVQAKVTKTGAVTDVGLVSGDPVLGAAAMKAVRLWKYEPFLQAGAPLEAEINVTMQFRLTTAPPESAETP